MAIEIRDLELHTRPANVSWLMMRYARAQRRRDLMELMAVSLDVLEAGLTQESYIKLLDAFDAQPPTDEEFEQVFQGVIEGAAKAPLDESATSSPKPKSSKTGSRTNSSKPVDLAPTFQA